MTRSLSIGIIVLTFSLAMLKSNEAAAKFKPFSCAKEVVSCIKAVGSGVKLLKAAKKACGNFKGCKKKCKAEKKACKKQYKDSRKALKSAGMDDWVQNLCKKGKLDCRDMCKLTYMTPECVSARSAVSDWILANKNSKKASIGNCVKALDVCIPSKITSCMGGVYLLAAENKSIVQLQAKLIKKQCALEIASICHRKKAHDNASNRARKTMVARSVRNPVMDSPSW
ncbi:MAG TPA: hypothetical protein EYN66_24635 [Myxococcales bacterium]|nr:hypothetical protein [Myxococcales bacterium]